MFLLSRLFMKNVVLLKYIYNNVFKCKESKCNKYKSIQKANNELKNRLIGALGLYKL